jgi:branched-chain amino acid transport system permease protein
VSKGRLSWQVMLIILLAALVPAVIRDAGILYIINMMYLMAIPAMSLNLIMSTGHVNFAHAAFVAIGAYSSTFLSMHGGLPFWFCFPLAGIIGALVAWGIGSVILRIKGPYFFLVTVAFGEVVIRSATHFKEITGGHQGIEMIPKPSITIPGLFAFQFKSETSFYYLMLAALVVSLMAMYRLQRGHWGLTWRAAREADMVAESAGVDVIRYKVVAFSTSCFFAAMGGSFYAHYVSFINPGTFGMMMMFSLLMSVIVGGREYFYGPLIGTIVLRGLSAFTARAQIPEYEPMVYGTILALIIIFLPAGISGLPSKFAAKGISILSPFGARRKTGEPA